MIHWNCFNFKLETNSLQNVLRTIQQGTFIVSYESGYFSFQVTVDSKQVHVGKFGLLGLKYSEKY